MKTPKITSINIRTDGKPIGICRQDEEGLPEYDKISLIAIPLIVPQKEYLVSAIGVEPFILDDLENPLKFGLEASFKRLINSRRPMGEYSAINNGVPLRVYSDDSYTGALFFGERFDKMTRKDSNYREIIPLHVLGNLAIKRYKYPETTPDFENLKKYLNRRNRQATIENRRAA